MEPTNTSGILPPDQIARVFNKSGLFKASLSPARFFVYAILGGAFIALGGLLALVVGGGMPGLAASAPGLTKLIMGALFPMGLVLVVLAGGSLFTSDCAVLPFSVWQGKLGMRSALRIATLGYLGHFVGALLVAWLLGVQTGTLSAEPWRTATIQLAMHKTHASFLTVFVKGIGANLMVCLAVWMAYAAQQVPGKVILLWLPVMAFVAFGWEHSIANMFFIPAAMLLDAPISMTDFLWSNLLPATLGNIVGGMAFVAWPYFFLFGQTKSKVEIPASHNGQSAQQAPKPVRSTQLN